MGTADADQRKRAARPMAASVIAVAVLLVASVVEAVLAVPPGVFFPTALLCLVLIPVPIITEGRMRRVRLAGVGERERAAVERQEFLRLRAPNPRPGQCPVCSLEDLDQLGVDDELAAEIDPECMQVVPYGPWRAHYACARTVPYADPDAARREAREAHGRGEHACGAVWNCRACADGPATYLVTGSPVTPPSPEKLAAKERCVCKQCHAETGRPYLAPDRKALGASPRRGKLRQSFINALAEEAAAAGEKLQRELGMAPAPIDRDEMHPSILAHLTWAGSHSWESWQKHGFTNQAEAAQWYGRGFTPWTAQSWRQAGFTDPAAVVRTGCTWPTQLRNR